MNLHNPELARQAAQAKAVRARIEAPRDIVQTVHGPRVVFIVPLQTAHISTWRYHLREQAALCNRLFVGDVLDACVAAFDISAAELRGPRGRVSLTQRRQVGMYVATAVTKASTPEIGRRFGGRDHTTVLHAKRKIKSLLTHCSETQSMVAAVMRKLGLEPTCGVE